MSELLALTTRWLLSPGGAMLAMASVILAAFAISYSRTRAVASFLVVPLCLWVAFSAWAVLSSTGVRSALASILWALSVLFLYAIVLAPLVARAWRPKGIVLVSAAALVVQVPLSLFTVLLFTCYIGHDCP